MLKSFGNLTDPDPYYVGAAGFVGSSLQSLHEDMREFDLPSTVPDGVRRSHDAVRHAYIYSYFSYDLLTLAASQTFPCLELALRARIGHQFVGRTKKGKSHPAMLDELLKAAKKQKMILSEIDYLSQMRNMFAHGSDSVLNPPMFLAPFEAVTQIIRELFAHPGHDAADDVPIPV